MPLRGADLVLLAMQELWRGHGVSNNTVMVVECDGALDLPRLRRALDRFVDICPWPIARLRRSFPWGALHWAVDARNARVAPPLRHRLVGSPAALHREVEAELNAAIDPRREPPIRLAILDEQRGPAAPRSWLVVTWFHPLMDPRGGQNLLAHLAHLDETDGRAPWAGVPPPFVPTPDRRPLRERGRLGRRSQRYLRTLIPALPVSPGTSLTRPGRARFRQESFVGGKCAVGEGRVTREISFRLAVVGRTMAELWRRRGLPDTPFLVPIAVDLRPKGEAGPTFGNVLGFHFARFRPSETADLSGLVRALRQQMVDALRDGQIEANAVGMEFLRYRPVSVMLRDLPGTHARETFSFNCADLRDFPAVPLFGRRILNAYHVPSVLPRPGVGVFFNRCGPTSNLVISWIDGAVTEDDVARMVEVVRVEMGWVRAS
ncbi:MAG TPA: hypothetical protein VLD61_01620 [Methylomirabilota bacterium]|nr:hypothetical protein [Methylomirabilota bacterium]